jgi:hypothetical protein
LRSATSTCTPFSICQTAWPRRPFALAINQTGVVTGKTVVLIPLEDMDKAAKKVVDCRPPGH